MKVLYIGGMKSGKSKLAEARTLSLSQNAKPYYLATTEIMDAEMHDRVARHKARRQENFETVEEPVKLYDTLHPLKRPVLVECLSIWLNNMLYYGADEAAIDAEIDRILKLKNDLVFVLNDVGSGIIPDNALARQFVDLSGRVAQKLAAVCDEVYFCIAGLEKRMK